MKTTVSVYDFRDAFQRAGRGNQFSYEGLGALFEYLEQYEADSGQEIELDVVGLCCEYQESTIDEIAEQYDIDLDGVDEDEITEAVREYLEYEGALIGEVPGGFVYRAH